MAAEGAVHTTEGSPRHAAGARIGEIRDALSRLAQGSANQVSLPAKSKTLNMKVKDPRDLLKQQVEHAYAELAAKEADLKTAAEIGQQLLDRLEADVAAMAALEEKVAQRDEELEALREERRRWERRERQHKVEVEELALTKQSLEQRLARASDELRDATRRAAAAGAGAGGEAGARAAQLAEELRRAREEAQAEGHALALERAKTSQLRAELEAVQRGGEELARLEAELADLRVKAERFDALRERHEEAREELEDLKSKWIDLSHMARVLREENVEAHYIISQQQEELAQLRDHVLTLQGGSGFSLAGIERDRPQPAGAGAGAGSAPGSGAGSTASTPPLVKSSPSLAEELEEQAAAAAAAAPDEKKGVLRRVQDRVLRALNRDTEPPAAAGAAADGEAPRARHVRAPLGSSGSAASDSDAGEAGGVGGGGRESEAAAAAAAAAAAGGGAARRRALEPADSHPLQFRPVRAGHEEESDEDLMRRQFFLMTLLAVKLNSGDMLERVAEVSGKRLYARAQALKVPFHEYIDWIKREIIKSYIEGVYEGDARTRRAAPAAAPRRVERPVRGSGMPRTSSAVKP